MHKSLQFLANKSVLLFGAALAILANPFTYVVIGSVIVFTRSIENNGVSFNTHEPFIQAMLLTSMIGFVIVILSRVSTWILAYRKIKSTKV